MKRFTSVRFILHFLKEQATMETSTSYSLPPFPSFSTLKAGTVDRKIINELQIGSITSEHFRLTAVAETGFEKWLLLDERDEEHSLTWEKGALLRNMNLKIPTLFKNPPLSDVGFNVDYQSFLKHFKGNIWNAKLLPNLQGDQGASLIRCPLGQGYTIKVRAEKLFTKIGKQPFYLSQVIQKIPFGNPAKIFEKFSTSNGKNQKTSSQRQPPIVNLWAGSSNLTAPLHYDSFNNLVVQIKGSKTFYLFPPKFLSSVSLYPKLHVKHRQAQLNLNDPDFDRFPLARTMLNEGRAITLHPGQALFIPKLWLHQVKIEDGEKQSSDGIVEDESNRPPFALSVSIFSRSQALEAVYRAWDVKLPMQKGWDVSEVTLAARVFISLLIENVFPTILPSTFVSLLLTERYEPILYGDSFFSPELFNKCKESHSKHAKPILKKRFNLLNPKSKFPKEVPEPHCQTHRSEYLKYQDSCFSAPACSKPAMRSDYCPSGNEEWIRRRIDDMQKRKKKKKKKKKKKEKEKGTEEPNEGASHSSVLDRLSAPFITLKKEHEAEAKCHLKDMIEDIAAAAVGDSEAYFFLKQCF
eukprot:g3111.t1